MVSADARFPAAGASSRRRQPYTGGVAPVRGAENTPFACRCFSFTGIDKHASSAGIGCAGTSADRAVRDAVHPPGEAFGSCGVAVALAESAQPGPPAPLERGIGEDAA